MGKTLCESYPAIRLPLLKKADMLKIGLNSKSLIWNKDQAVSIISQINSQDAFIEILFRIPKSSEVHINQIQLSTTPCFLGGKRYWFNCPSLRNGNLCNRRVSILYLNGITIGCRKCFDLLYESQFEKRRGSFWILDRFIRVSTYIDEKLHKRRTKFFKNRPSKYVSKWLYRSNRIERLARQTEQILDSLK